MTIIGTLRTNKKGTKMTKIIGMMRNNDFLSYLVRNKFVIYFSTIKGMRRNEKEKLFLMNGNFFRNGNFF